MIISPETGNTSRAAAQVPTVTAASDRATQGKAHLPIARAGGGALEAVAAFAQLVAEASENTLAANPLIGIQRGDVAAAAMSLLKAMTTAPFKAAAHYGRYLTALAEVARGTSELVPESKDRRSDPAWKSNALYARLTQAHLAMHREFHSFIEGSTLDARETGKARYFASLVTDALAPSNFILGNPVAVRKIIDTGGGNLVNGLKNLVHDILYNSMLPSQVDATHSRWARTSPPRRGRSYSGTRCSSCCSSPRPRGDCTGGHL